MAGAKLSRADRETIVVRVLAGDNYGDLAAEFGVRHGRVGQIARQPRKCVAGEELDELALARARSTQG